MQQLFDAVQALHLKGLVHRDICASNIYWVDQSTALLNDWSHVGKFTFAGGQRDFRLLQEAVKHAGASDDLQGELFKVIVDLSVAKRGREE